MKHKVVFQGTKKARCICGLWTGVAIPPNGRDVLRNMYEVHRYEARSVGEEVTFNKRKTNGSR